MFVVRVCVCVWVGVSESYDPFLGGSLLCSFRDARGL